MAVKRWSSLARAASLLQVRPAAGGSCRDRDQAMERRPGNYGMSEVGSANSDRNARRKREALSITLRLLFSP